MNHLSPLTAPLNEFLKRFRALLDEAPEVELAPIVGEDYWQHRWQYAYTQLTAHPSLLSSSVLQSMAAELKQNIRQPRPSGQATKVRFFSPPSATGVYQSVSQLETAPFDLALRCCHFLMIDGVNAVRFDCFYEVLKP